VIQQSTGGKNPAGFRRKESNRVQRERIQQGSEETKSTLAGFRRNNLKG
jgi:hypothetical protein